MSESPSSAESDEDRPSTISSLTHREYLISRLEAAIEHLRDETTVIRGSDVRAERNHRFIRQDDEVRLLPADTFSGRIYLQYELPIPEEERTPPRRINPDVAQHEQVAVVDEEDAPLGVTDGTRQTQTDE